MLARLPDQTEPNLLRVQEFLRVARSSAGFQLLYSDLETMAWPVVMAAAAWLAETADGIVRADDGTWLLPGDSELTTIFEEHPQQQKR